MKLIIGLGNPGEKYKKTRHNIGFLFLDFLSEKYGLEKFHIQKKFNAEICHAQIGLEKVLLVKPQTFMNLSGQSLSSILGYFRIEKQNILICEDDLDSNFGDIKYREKGGHGGHNGLRSIFELLKTQNIPRIKLGIANETLTKKGGNIPPSNFVLQKFTEQELLEISEKILKQAEAMLQKKQKATA